MKIDLSEEELIALESCLDGRISNYFQIGRISEGAMTYLNSELIGLQALRHKITEARRALAEGSANK